MPVWRSKFSLESITSVPVECLDREVKVAEGASYACLLITTTEREAATVLTPVYVPVCVWVIVCVSVCTLKQQLNGEKL